MLPTAISCVRVGACVAVGLYAPLGAFDRAMAADEVNGRWQRGFPMSTPPNALAGSNRASLLSAVVCLARRTCLASGDYDDRFGNEQGVASALSLP